MDKIKVIITGATGMVGEGVLYLCLNHPEIAEVLVISRTATGYTHPKLKEIIHSDFADISSLGNQLKGYDACYFCLGVTSVGKRMWARVKGKTENDLMKLPFRQVYNFRPGGIEPFLPLRPSQTYYKSYKYVKWLFPIMKIISPGFMITLKELGTAMINASLLGYSKNALEMSDIKVLAKQTL